MGIIAENHLSVLIYQGSAGFEGINLAPSSLIVIATWRCRSDAVALTEQEIKEPASVRVRRAIHTLELSFHFQADNNEADHAVYVKLGFRV